eukprot:CAMPEP_0178486956 /NCGR_PEP_ID=MMETSP0696-20121128/9071_1 /TAXON_ID=265572 /ORGANISM="Extubocellulus spinifer, Strain CCMP396" /LENGTH=78 /DNA_ID=CAMNT_0020114629 /DNA_START=188 /DNA_END=421 /DNA_ORIENTATION=+
MDSDYSDLLRNYLKLGGSSSSAHRGVAGGDHHANGVDDAVVAGNVDGEVAELPEGLLAEDGVVDEILAELAGVGDGLA